MADAGDFGLGIDHAGDEIVVDMSRLAGNQLSDRRAEQIARSLSEPARLVRALRAEIGHRRPDGCPFDRFACLNSGSEAVIARGDAYWYLARAYFVARHRGRASPWPVIAAAALIVLIAVAIAPRAPAGQVGDADVELLNCLLLVWRKRC